MSISARFLYHKPFVVCSELDVEPGEEWDHVAFETEPEDPTGNPGLTQAMRFWWDIEQIEATPSGTISRVTPTPYSASFSKGYKAVGMDTDGLNEALTEGPMVEGWSSTDPEVAVVEPRNRVCYEHPDINLPVGIVSNIYVYYTGAEQGGWAFAVCFIGGEWRLYYRYEFFVSVGDIAGRVANPAYAVGATAVASGTTAFRGLTLDWAGYEYGGGTLDSAGITFATTDFTYP